MIAFIIIVLAIYVYAKEIWLSFYYLKQGDIGNANSHRINIEDTEETHISISLCDGIIMYKNGEHELAKEKVRQIYGDLKYPVLKEMANEVLDS